jgi:16S rRNA (cytosine967-C5)-methyltransferase
MHFYSHIQSARQIIEGYNGKEPFHRYIRAFFAQHKKFGSRDRKQVSGLCYAYWRLGGALEGLSLEDKILAGHFVCAAPLEDAASGNISDPVLEQLKPAWNAALSLSIPEKFALITGRTNAWEEESKKIFPWVDQLSDGIDREKFILSFFIQPDLFLRARPGKEKQVADKLSKAGVNFESITASAFAMPNSTKIDGLIALDAEAVVQDLSSQQVAELLQMVPASSAGIRLWDCCAGSGGKTILAFDTIKKLAITVSDKREQILVNLAKRFREAGIGHYQSLLADMTVGSGRNPSKYNYDLIIADVPCSGSGTWGRTPEWLRFFDTTAIDTYSELQKKIVTHAIPYLVEGGYFLYITCSVFRKENEEVVEFIQANAALELVKTAVLKGYNRKADTMFAALFRK